MSDGKAKPYTNVVKDLMGKKSYILSKAQALSEVFAKFTLERSEGLTDAEGLRGMLETTQPLFLSAAAYEERIAPLLDTLGRELEAAVHRISAASCYQKAGYLHRAVNLYRAALSGPLRDDTRSDVLKMLNYCLDQLNRHPTEFITPPHVQEVTAAV
jgi:hypothetical protein